MVERMVRSTCSYNNVHEVVDDNNNPYRNMVMDAMRMNQGYVDQCSIVDEEPDINAIEVFFFFYLLKDSNEPFIR